MLWLYHPLLHGTDRINNSDQLRLHMRFAVNENAVKTKASEAPFRTPLGELSALPQTFL